MLAARSERAGMTILVHVGGWRIAAVRGAVGMSIPLAFNFGFLWCYGPSGLHGGYYWRGL